MAPVNLGYEWECRVEKDEHYYRDLSALFKELRSQSLCNVEYFRDGKQLVYERFHLGFGRLCDHLGGIEPIANQLIKKFHTFDVSPEIPANGYRSMISVVHKCCTHLLQLTRYITINRDSFLFRSNHYSKELEAYVNTLGQLRACLFYLDTLTRYCEDGQLFPDDVTLSADRFKKAEELMINVESLNQEPFYGRCLGFQYCDSMVRPLTVISLVMASYGEGYSKNNIIMKLATSVLGGGKYLLDPELRAEQIVNVTCNSDIQFCKDFWSVAEYNLLHQLPLYICPTVQLDRVINLAPEAFNLPKCNGDGDIKINPPCAHTGHAPVNTRLISFQLRRGQEMWTVESNKPVTDVAEASHGLVLHCHGGGFVAQSSASHEVYLRHWAKDLGMPILAVDYSLAPENPFPRALEEVFYAYCWALKNAQQLGWTGEKVCLVGDSAGANLVMAAALRAASFGVRVPDGIMSVYGCLLVKYIPSPSRIMALMDPLLPLGILSKCLAAYAAVSDEQSVNYGNPFAACEQTQEGDQSDGNNISDEYVSDCGSPASSPTDTKSKSVASPKPSKLIAEFNRKASVSHDSGFIENIDANDNSQFGGVYAAQMPRDQSQPVVDKSQLSLDIGSGGGSKRRHLCRSPSSPGFYSSPLSSSPEDLSTQSRGMPHFAHIRHFAQSPFSQFSHVPIASNPFMSPYLASDSLLKSLCPVSLVACHLDPMLDDSVMFARRLRSLGRPVRIDVLPQLPHGFLNFVLVSRDAKRASDLCVRRLLMMLRRDDEDTVFSMDDNEDDQWHVIG